MSKPNAYQGEERRGRRAGDGWDNGNGNGYGLLAGLPAWVRAITVLGATGVMCAIAAYLVWLGGQSIPAIERQQIQFDLQHEQSNKLLLQHMNQEDKLFRLEQQICQHTSKTENERDRCLDP